MSMGPDTIIIAPFPEMKLKKALFTDFLHAKKLKKKGPPRLPRIDTGTGLCYNVCIFASAERKARRDAVEARTPEEERA